MFPPPIPSAPAPVGPVSPPGWFSDPGGAPGLRYWDGRTWTPYTSPAPIPDEADHPTLPVVAAIWAVAITVASLIGSRLILDALGSLDLPIVAYVALAAVIGYGPMVAFCFWASRRWGSGVVRRDVGATVQWVDAGWGPLIYLAALATQIVVGIAVFAVRIPMKSNTEGLDELAGDRNVLIAFLITAVIVAPIVEEMMFRGVVLRGLLSVWPTQAAVAAQGVLFGLAHVDPSRGVGNVGLVLVLAAVGVVFGAAAYLLRRVGPSMIAHAMFNGVAMAIVLLIKA